MIIFRHSRVVLTTSLFLLLISILIQGCESERLSVDGTIRTTASSSSNIVMSADGKHIYTANGDVNTVTLFDILGQRRIAEIQVGRDPNYLALSPDGRYLYVSCRYANEILVIDTRDHQVIRHAEVGLEPMGIVVSPDGEELYVANYRSSTVSVLEVRSMKEIETISTSGGPMALAITSAGDKLYAAEFPGSTISVIDPIHHTIIKNLTLAVSPDRSDRKKSQGIPNSIQKLAIAPNGEIAWAAHLLTNVDTPIQFEEVIFPAFSQLKLSDDTEWTEGRKQLFEEMDVKDTINETMIVSDPVDVVFAPDGSKAYALFSGSEDLMVFDLRRGGNAVQVLRRIPGDHPGGMVISPDGERLYVNNTMTHDLVLIETGGSKTYAQARSIGDPVSLIEKDPLEPIIRKGKTIFTSANSDEFPIIGNNWMSCMSCHAGGEINGLTFMTPKGPRNTPSNVLALKTGLMMWDGSRDDFSDYILTVQGEMGGLMDIDPGELLSKGNQSIFDALEAYLNDDGSFPVPSNPYLNEDGTMTRAAQEGQELFEKKAGCIQCHDGGQLTDSIKAVNGAGKLTTTVTDYLYDVGTGTSKDIPSAGDARASYTNLRSGHEFDAPTLRGVWATAPYLHDGSALTLRDVLVTRNPNNQHGRTSDLSEEEISNLMAYLQSLK